MRELSKNEIHEVSGGDGFIDDFFGDGIVGRLITSIYNLFDSANSGWIERLFGTGD